MSTRTGLREFDVAYLDFYPYLEGYLRRATVAASSVVEVGLGLGTVSRWLAQRVPRYVGVDVATGAVDFVRASFEATGLKGDFHRRSILDTVAPDLGGQVDAAVAIGCLHHTGDLASAVGRLESLVRPGGRVLMMVYNDFSPKRVVRHPLRAVAHLRQARSGERLWWAEEDEQGRGTHDVDSAGQAAPLTEFAAVKSWPVLSEHGVRYKVTRQNFNRVGLPRTSVGIPRDVTLSTVGRWWGTDLYAEGILPD